jgi:hypothetical protein
MGALYYGVHEIYTYNSNGLLESAETEMWDGAAWTSYVKYTITYNTEGIEYNAYLWNVLTSTWDNYMYCWANYNPIAGIKENDVITNGFSLYPNPFAETATITISDLSLLNSYISIFDSQGKLVKSVLINSNSIIINRNELTSGFYFYSVNDTINGKLIIE